MRAVRALHSLAAANPTAPTSIVKNGAISPLVTVLTRGKSEESRTEAGTLLQALADSGQNLHPNPNPNPKTNLTLTLTPLLQALADSGQNLHPNPNPNPNPNLTLTLTPTPLLQALADSGQSHHSAIATALVDLIGTGTTQVPSRPSPTLPDLP